MISYSQLNEALNTGEHKILVKHYINQFNGKCGLDSNMENKLKYSNNGVMFSLLVYSVYLRYTYEFSQGKYNYNNFKNVFDNFKYDSTDDGVSFYLDPFGIKLEGLDYFNSLNISKDAIKGFIDDLNSLLTKISYNISSSAIDSYLNKDSIKNVINNFVGGKYKYNDYSVKTRSLGEPNIENYSAYTEVLTINKNNPNDIYDINKNIKTLLATKEIPNDNYFNVLIGILYKNFTSINNTKYTDSTQLINTLSDDRGVDIYKNINYNLNKLHKFNLSDDIVSNFTGFKKDKKIKGYNDYIISINNFYEIIDNKLFENDGGDIINNIININFDGINLVEPGSLLLWYYYISMYSNIRNYMMYIYENAYGEEEKINTNPILPDNSNKSGYDDAKNIKVVKNNNIDSKSDTDKYLSDDVKTIQGKLGGETGIGNLVRGRGVKQEVANMQVGMITIIIKLGYKNLELNRSSLKQIVEGNPNLNDDRFKKAFSELNIIDTEKLKKGDVVDIPSKLNDGIFGFRTEYLIIWFKLIVNDSYLIPDEYKFKKEEINGIFDGRTREILNYLLDTYIFNKIITLEPSNIVNINTGKVDTSSIERRINTTELKTMRDNGLITQDDFNSVMNVLKKIKS